MTVSEPSQVQGEVGRIAPSILSALKDCDSWPAGMFVWKRARMAKAVALGLAHEIPDVRKSGLTAFALTDAGRAVLSSTRKDERA